MHLLSPYLRDLAAFCAARGVAAWLVGGAVRDLARGVVPADIDVAVAADGVALAQDFADSSGGSFVALDHERGTGRVVLPAQGDDVRPVLDLVQLRAPTIAEDLRKRDFTINALALALEGALGAQPDSFIDPLGGLADLRAGLLRACDPHSLRDDPLRILRATRLAAALGLRVDPALAAQIGAVAPGLALVASERVRDELLKLLDTPAAAPWLRYLDENGALTPIFPELEAARACVQPSAHFLPVLGHLLETVAALEWLLAQLPNAPAQPSPALQLPVAVRSHPALDPVLPYADRIADRMAQPYGSQRRAALLKLAALLHDVGKPQTKRVDAQGSISFHEHQVVGAEQAHTIARRLCLSKHDALYVRLIVREHMRPGQLRASEELTRRAIVRFFRASEEAGLDLLVHELADHLATRGPRIDPRSWQAHLAWVELLLRAHWEQPAPPAQPLLRGDELIAALGIKPGPQVGTLLREIDEARASGEIATRAEALALAQRLKDEH